METLRQIKNNNPEEYSKIVAIAAREGIKINSQMTLEEFKSELYESTVTRKTLIDKISNAGNKALRR
jgi:hypothetical protein